MLRFHTLGRLELIRQDAGIDEPLPVQPKRLALLAFLVLAPPVGVRRDTLMALLWPEAAPDEGRRALRQALYYLRQFLGDGVLVSRADETVAIAQDRLWCDALAFDAAVSAGRAADAVALYRGDFLEGQFAADVSPDFEQWADQVRTRLRDRAVQTLWAVADQEAQAGRQATALDAARRAHALAPDDERGARRLMQLLDRLGNRGTALRVYQDLILRLEQEFGAAPSAETRALGDALRAADGGAPAAQPAPPAPPPDAPAPAAAPRPNTLVRKLAVGALAAAVVVIAAVAAVRASRAAADPTLLASGRIRLRDRVLVADFQNHTHDPLLAGAVTEAIRADLAQSRIVRLMSAQQVQTALRRMEQPAGAPLADSVVREVALREGAKSYVTGDVASLGARYTISAQLVSAESGELLASVRETAADSTTLLAALGRLSRAMRTRIGESARDARAARPLEQVTTASLQALRLYSQATRALNYEADRARGRALLQQAVALDTTFAAALIRLGIEYGLIGETSRAVEMQARAFRHRDRLGEREGEYVAAFYYETVAHDYERTMGAYTALMKLDSTDVRALNNAAFLQARLRNFSRSEELYSRAVRADSSIVVVWNGLQEVLINRGNLGGARIAIDRAHELFPGNVHLEYTEIYLAVAQGDYAAAERHAQLMVDGSPDDAIRQADGYRTLADLALLHGRVAASTRYRRLAMRNEEDGGYLAHYVGDALTLAMADVLVRQVSPAMEVLTRHPFDSLPALDRPYIELAALDAAKQDGAGAHAVAADFERNRLGAGRFGEAAHHHLLGTVALADAHYTDAATELRQAAESEQCVICALPELATAYDRAGATDSAVAVYERYLATPWMQRLELDAVHLPRICERLGAIYDARRDASRAAGMYRRLIGLWRSADPELAPRVAAARRHLAALAVEP